MSTLTVGYRIEPHRSPKAVVAGLYVIVNSKNGKMYGGSSVNIAFRWASHLTALCQDKHWNPHLQAAWRSYGPDAFECRVVAEPAIDVLLDEEQKLIDELFAAGIQYNISRHPRAPFRGRKHSDEWKAAHSARNKGRRVPIGCRYAPEVIAKTSAAVSKALTGRPLSESHRAALRKGWEKRHLKGPVTEETRKKIGETSRRMWSEPGFRAKHRAGMAAAAALSAKNEGRRA